MIGRSAERREADGKITRTHTRTRTPMNERTNEQTNDNCSVLSYPVVCHVPCASVYVRRAHVTCDDTIRYPTIRYAWIKWMRSVPFRSVPFRSVPFRSC